MLYHIRILFNDGKTSPNQKRTIIFHFQCVAAVDVFVYKPVYCIYSRISRPVVTCWSTTRLPAFFWFLFLFLQQLPLSHGGGLKSRLPPPDSHWALNNEAVCVHLFYDHIQRLPPTPLLMHLVEFQGFLTRWSLERNMWLRLWRVWQTAVFCLEWIIYGSTTCSRCVIFCICAPGMSDRIGTKPQQATYRAAVWHVIQPIQHKEHHRLDSLITAPVGL